MTTEIPPVTNFGYVRLTGGPYAIGATSISLTAGDGANLPDPSVDGGTFTLTAYNGASYTSALSANLQGEAQVLTVTARSADTLTVDATTVAMTSDWVAYRGLTQTDWDAVDTALASNLDSGWVNVKHPTYGATGDGSTDDAAAIQTALNAGAASLLPVFFPPGEYMVGTTLTLDQTVAAGIFGAPGLRSRIRAHSNLTGSANLMETDNAGGQEGPKIHNLLFQGNTTCGNLLHLQNCKGAEVHSCQFTNGAATFAQLRISNGTQSYHSIKNCRFHSTGTDVDYGIHIGGGAGEAISNIWIENCWSAAISNGNGFSGGNIVFLDGVTADGCHFRDCKFDGLDCTGGAIRAADGSGHTFWNVFTEFNSTATRTDDWYFDNVSDVTLTRCSAGDANTTNGVRFFNGCERVKWVGSVFAKNITFSSTGDDMVVLRDCTLRSGVTITNYSWPEHRLVDCRTTDGSDVLTGSFAQGSGAIANGTTSDTITHGYPVIPNRHQIIVNLANDPDNTPGAVWVSAPGATTFVVNCENDPGASGLNFTWMIVG